MGYELPTPDPVEYPELKATLTKDGLLYKGVTYPYREIAKFKATAKDELTVTFRDKAIRVNPETGADEEYKVVDPATGEAYEELLIEIDEDAARLLLEAETFVVTTMMQKGEARYDSSIPQSSPQFGEKIINAPAFDMKKVAKEARKAVAY